MSLCKLHPPPSPPVRGGYVLHGREVSPFYKNLKPVNNRPAVVVHSSVTVFNPTNSILTPWSDTGVEHGKCLVSIGLLFHTAEASSQQESAKHKRVNNRAFSTAVDLRT